MLESLVFYGKSITYEHFNYNKTNFAMPFEIKFQILYWSKLCSFATSNIFIRSQLF